MNSLFSKLKIADKVKWWIVDKHPAGGIYGCFESHYCVWNSPEFSKKYLCIFEDDLQLNEMYTIDDFYKMLEIAKNNIPEKFSLLNLEPKLGYITKHLDKNIYLGEFLHLGCYIIGRECLPMLSSKIIQFYGIDIDVALYKTCQCAGIFPKLFIQEGKDSDNDGGHRRLNLHNPSLGKDWDELLKISPFLGWLTMECSYIGALFLRQNIPELKERRSKINVI